MRRHRIRASPGDGGAQIKSRHGSTWLQRQTTRVGCRCKRRSPVFLGHHHAANGPPRAAQSLLCRMKQRRLPVPVCGLHAMA
eukprot:4205229-Prymnesium_polylepis.1